jgi:hypothetical protein
MPVPPGIGESTGERPSAGKHTIDERVGEHSSKRRYQATVENVEEENGGSETDDDSDEGEGKQTSVIRKRRSKRQ